jgi:hypothetical protein
LYVNLSHWYALLAGIQSEDCYLDFFETIMEIEELVLPYVGPRPFDVIQQCDNQDEGDSAKQKGVGVESGRAGPNNSLQQTGHANDVQRDATSTSA